ncbi:helix-turn-helix domain-containing protein [Chitinibacter sp. SCUT-21]|uniref:sugar diacid recognition domain-containing protein n=1 Tax=Chitinibacter sp. SCUT-21 TaxID=2970891 RepID=UPI0035A6D238
MSKLSVKLAQEIARRTMALLPYNINVMDEHGVILASGLPDRVGQRHEGAILAIGQGRVLEIDAATAAHLQGVKPGVNLPLYSQGQIVGVIGITGDPDVVRPMGELVRMCAEMMLEQKAMLRSIERDARLYEDLVLQLIQRQSISDQSLARWAERLGVDLSVPRVALVIRASGNMLDSEAGLTALQQLQYQLLHFEATPLLARHSFDEFVLLRPALDELGRWNPAAQRRQLSGAINDLQAKTPLKLRAVLGHYFMQEGGLALSYQTACATLQQANSDDILQLFDEERLPVLLAPLAQGWQAELLCAPIERIRAHDRKGVYLATLSCWFAHDLNLQTTAQALNIHRNTLDYRLSRIAELSKLDLSRLEDRVQIYIALQLPALSNR